MRKIPTIYERPWDNPDPKARALVTQTPNPEAAWVFAGEGVATEKTDGTAVLVKAGNPFKRLEIKRGKTPPPGWFPADNPDEETGKQVGWIGVVDRDPADRWHLEAVIKGLPTDGTYELVGPKVQGNPYDLESHELWRHGDKEYDDVPTDYEALRVWLAENHVEGLVWHHPDGRMAKIKRRDFGLPWP